MYIAEGSQSRDRDRWFSLQANYRCPHKEHLEMIHCSTHLLKHAWTETKDKESCKSQIIFQQKLMVIQWNIKVQEAMKEARVDEAVIEKVLVISAGHFKYRHLPGWENWLSKICNACVNVTSEEAGMALSRVNQHRLKATHEHGLVRPLNWLWIGLLVLWRECG